MQVKIFQAFGKNEINDMEDIINDWMEAEPSTLNIVHTNSAAASVGEDGGETYQTLIVTAWYNYSN